MSNPTVSPGQTALEQRVEPHRWLVARGELSVSRSDLSARQSASERCSCDRAHQAAPARTLGNYSREFYLRPFKPDHQGAQS